MSKLPADPPLCSPRHRPLSAKVASPLSIPLRLTTSKYIVETVAVSLLSYDREGSIPKQLGDMRILRSVNLSGNKLSGTHFVDICTQAIL